MKIEIDVPDSIVADIKRRTGQEFDAAEIEEALRVYYCGLAELEFDQPRSLSEFTKKSVFGAAFDTSCRC
jgi:hypothetical protein